MLLQIWEGNYKRKMPVNVIKVKLDLTKCFLNLTNLRHNTIFLKRNTNIYYI